MEEKTKYLEWGKQPEEKEQNVSNNSRFRHAALTWAAILWTFAIVSCDSRTNDPVKQQERIIRHTQDLEYVSHKLSVKIESRKPKVEEYNRLMAQYQAEPDNAALKKYIWLLEKEILEYNKEIESLAKEKLNKTVRLDNDRSRSQNGMNSGRHLTDENYYDFLLNN